MSLKTPLTEEQKFEAADFTKREEVIALFPLYKREQLASRKPLPKSVNIPDFTMKTPFKDKTLLNHSELVLEPNRRQALFGPNSCGKTILFSYMLNGEIEGFPTHPTSITARSWKNTSLVTRSSTLSLSPTLILICC